MVEAFLISIKLSLLTTILMGLIGPFIAYFIAYKNFIGKSFIEALFTLPLVLPPTVLGFYLLILLSPDGFIGKYIKDSFGFSLTFSFWGLLIGSLIYSSPFGINPIVSAFEKIDKRFVEVSYSFGYSPLETFLKVIVPNSLGAIFNSLILTFSHTMGEFGVVLMLGGDIPGKTQTLSIYVFDEVNALSYKEAYEASFILMSFSFISVLIINFYKRRKESWNKLLY